MNTPTDITQQRKELEKEAEEILRQETDMQFSYSQFDGYKKMLVRAMLRFKGELRPEIEKSTENLKPIDL